MANNSFARKDDPSYDDEIVALLHQVGQRLINSEQDRKELKRAMDDLMEKADQGERAYLTIQDRISKTESAFEKRQKLLEKAQQAQEARIEKAAAMADKLEEAIAQHAKINRRLDKAAQEKAQMIRKLERIEEAVIETHEALNAKALALLSARQEKVEPAPAKAWLPQAPANDGLSEEERPWWRQHGPIRAAAVSAMVLLGVAGGWGVTMIQINAKNDVSQTVSLENPVAPAQDFAGAGLAPPPVAAYEDRPDETAQQQFTQTIEQALSGETQTAEETQPLESARQKPAAPAKKPESFEDPDPMQMSDEELLANLNNDPDVLAARLNEIVTGSAGDAMPEELDEAAPAAPAKTEKAAFTPQKNKIKETSSDEFLAAQRPLKPLAQRITPDPALPPVIKEVEKKAFEGVPEAQHDIAAIYTAGHGGVSVDYAKAAAWFRESALQGVANARYNLGVLYHQGLGVKADIVAAVGWYRAAAELGHPEAQYNLGIAYIEGVGAPYDAAKAALYFERAAKQGILEAAYNLGLIHENGLVGEARPDEALYWYKQAADQGSPEAKMAMDQLAKTLGLMPNEVERLYGSGKKEAAEYSSSRRAETAPPSPPSGASSSGVEYIEAQPLDAAEPVSVTAPISSGIDESSARPYQEDQAITAQVQEQLIRLGLYPGPADGVIDSVTADAIRAYQNDYNLKADGRPSQALLVHMMTSEMGSNEEYGSRE